MEVLITALILTGVLLWLWTQLSFSTRAYTRQDDRLQRARVAQAVLSRLRRDYNHVTSGPISFAAVPPKEVLKEAGFPGVRRDFFTSSRTATHQIHEYFGFSASPIRNRSYPFIERWREVKPGIFAWDAFASSYLSPPPQQRVAEAIPPMYPASAMEVPYPSNDPGSTFLLLNTDESGPVLWAHHFKTRGAHEAGTLLRWSGSTGFTRWDDVQVAAFRGEPLAEFAFIHKRPPEPEADIVRGLKQMGDMSVTLTTGEKVRGEDPPIELSAHALIGP